MRVAIIGATSGIGEATARCFASDGASFLLAGRNEQRLSAVAADLRVRGACSTELFVSDLADVSGHDSLVAAAAAPDVVLIAHGVLPDQALVDHDPLAQIKSFQVNATSVISLAARFAETLKRGATLAVIGSVAGDRGRRSNYVYGASKAAIHAYCDGLRSRLADAGVNVLLIKPGWVDTPMTSHMKRNPLFIDPETAGRSIHRAVRQRKATVYVPWYWRWISLIVRMLPARLVKF
jgi:short-subunit dehydrogenase